jgi:hypothetical protein
MLHVVDGDGFGPIPRTLKTIRDLVGYADRIPEHQVINAVCQYARRLGEVGAVGSGQHRHLIVIGALVNRAAFDILQVPKDPDYRL